jgi:hypothetical protein
MIATLVGASIGVPYFASQSPQGQNAANNAPPVPASANAKSADAAKAVAAPANVNPPALIPNPVTQSPAAPRLDGAQFTSVAQIFRFDVTKEWVYRNWSRKTTSPTDVGLFSVRVPLVMGTQPAALAGSLTYFFNSQGQVEHISFRGRTGDTTPLVQLLTRYYQFQRVEGPVGEQLYQVRSEDGVQSELRTKPEAIVRSSTPQQSIAVELEFARPGSQRFLPPHGAALQIPPTASAPAATPPPANSTTDSVSGAIKSAVKNYWDQARYATPDEEGYLTRNRWPE